MQNNVCKPVYHGRFDIKNVIFLAAMLSTISPIFLYAQQGVQKDYPHVPPGIDYIHRRIGDKPWSIHIARIDRKREDFSFITNLGSNRIFGLDTVQNQVAWMQAADIGKPLLAVNGDFFVIRTGPYQGDPLGLQIILGQLISDSRGSSFWIDKENNPHIGEVYTQISITGPGNFNIKTGLNEKCEDDSSVLYSPVLGRSTRTENCLEYTLDPTDKENFQPLHIGSEFEVKITKVSNGDSKLTPAVMALSIGKTLTEKIPKLSVGDRIKIKVSSSPNLKDAPTAIGGGQILIKDGKAFGLDKKSPRHPRTMLGYNKDFYFMVVVDGRQEGLSIGMDYPEQTTLMMELGCTDAINLDGGGSSTLWLNGRIMNSPSDGRQRPVANSIILVQKL